MKKKCERNGKNGKKNGLTPRNRQFIDNYINSGNATQAYIEAGYSPNGADRNAYKLLRIHEIVTEVEKRRLEIANDNNITASKIIKELSKIAFLKSSDVFNYGKEDFECEGVTIQKSVAYLKTQDEMSDEALSSISSIKETQHGGLEIKLYDKQKALDSLSKYVGLSNEAEILKARAIRDGEKGKTDTTIEDRIKEKMAENGFNQ